MKVRRSVSILHPAMCQDLKILHSSAFVFSYLQRGSLFELIKTFFVKFEIFLFVVFDLDEYLPSDGKLYHCTLSLVKSNITCFPGVLIYTSVAFHDITAIDCRKPEERCYTSKLFSL